MSAKHRGIAARVAVAVLSLALAAGPALAAQSIPGVQMPAKLPKAHGPAVATTMGQSPGSLMVKMLADLVKLRCDERSLITAGEFQAALKKKDTAYKALFITMGTSLKGMGAAGIDVDQEAKRVSALIAAAKKAGVLVIGTQLEGPTRRVDETDEKSIRTVAPHADLLLIRKDVDFDGYFAKLSKEKGIPLILVNQAMDAKEVLKVLFSL